MFKALSLLAVCVAASQAASITLTAANFEQEVIASGKNSFIKVISPLTPRHPLPRPHQRDYVKQIALTQPLLAR
jgi:hypothetical protein